MLAQMQEPRGRIGFFLYEIDGTEYIFSKGVLDGSDRFTEVGVMTSEKAALGTSASDVQSTIMLNAQLGGSSPCLGTQAFADACRFFDHRSFAYRFTKRTFDIAFSVVVIVAGFVPCTLLSMAIAIDTKGSPIYTQERVGRLGKPFRFFKFRSMVVDADDVEKYLSPAQLDQWEQERKVDDDPRITKLGKLLRETSLDELPQFLNVLAGQISVVGPRAISRDELNWYKLREQFELLSVPQGITGLWQVTSRNGATFRSGERQKLELEYVRSAGLFADAYVLAKTFNVMFGKKRTGR